MTLSTIGDCANTIAMRRSDWFDPLEEAVRGQARPFIEQLVEEKTPGCPHPSPIGKGRHVDGIVTAIGRQLVTTFGPLELTVLHARLRDAAGEREWKSTRLPV